MIENRLPQYVQPEPLAITAGAKALDAEAGESWGLDSFALVEAAGRACAQVFLNIDLPGDLFFRCRKIAVLAGSGNNAADALVMLRALILGKKTVAENCCVYMAKPENADNPKTPLSQAVLALQKIGVAVKAWENAKAAFAQSAGVLENRLTVIDGIAGTGLRGALHGAALEMAEAANSADATVVSIDMPSGAFDNWKPGMPMVRADFTIAVEPHKTCLYFAAQRQNAGTILAATGIFPQALMLKHMEAELVSWESATCRIKSVQPATHKYGRGVVQIMAGSPGFTGAARLCAMAAQAAGAGIVRLLADQEICPILAGSCNGIMVAAENAPEAKSRFTPDALLLGPGWGRGEDRKQMLESCLALEAEGTPLVLDADAIALSAGKTFCGNAILTPHLGEFSNLVGGGTEEIAAAPLSLLRRFAAEKKATVILKSHVMYVACHDGRTAVIDGMNPALAAGGSGDVLAGLCAGIAARSRAGGSFDPYDCACAAVALLVEAGLAENLKDSFADPGKLAEAAGAIAGRAWIRRPQ